MSEGEFDAGVPTSGALALPPQDGRHGPSCRCSANRKFCETENVGRRILTNATVEQEASYGGDSARRPP